MAPGEFGGDHVPRDAAFGEQDREVEDQVARFADQRRVILADSGDHRLDGFFAELLRDFAAALGGEAGDVGGFGFARGEPVVDDGLEPPQRFTHCLAHLCAPFASVTSGAGARRQAVARRTQDRNFIRR